MINAAKSNKKTRPAYPAGAAAPAKSEYFNVLEAALNGTNDRESADRPTSAQDVTAYDAGPREPRGARSRGRALLIGLIATGLAGVYFTYLKTGPQLAGAAMALQPAPSDVTITGYLASGPANLKQMDRQVRQTEKLVQQFQTDAVQIPLENLRTNPFQQSPATGNSDSPRQSALRAANALELQSTLVNDKNHSCMINNAMYLEGQAIEQFTVERIKSESVILRSGTYRFELKQR